MFYAQSTGTVISGRDIDRLFARYILILSRRVQGYLKEFPVLSHMAQVDFFKGLLSLGDVLQGIM